MERNTPGTVLYTSYVCYCLINVLINCCICMYGNKQDNIMYNT